MFQYLYDWMVNAAFYLVIFTAVMQLLPNEIYHKYVRFFTGLVMILLILTPAFKVLGMERSFRDFYEEYQTGLDEKELEEFSRILGESDLYMPFDEEENTDEETEEDVLKEGSEGWIHVEKIEIGQ